MFAIVFVLGSMTFGACDNQDPIEEDNLSASSQAVTTYRYVWNGQSADAYAGDALRGVSVNVWESGTGSDRRTFGGVWYYEADPSSAICEEYDGIPYCYHTRYTYVSGWGELPAADVLLRNDFARVQTNVGNGRPFNIEKCIVDQVAATYECTAVADGEMNVVWKKNGISSSFSAGTNMSKYGVYSFRSQGTSSSASADAYGTVFGISFGGSEPLRGEGYLGAGRSVTREVIKDTTGLNPK
jgi:hypothetical protein